jgi:hypothetical protein
MNSHSYDAIIYLVCQDLTLLSRHSEIRNKVGEAGEDGLAKAGKRLSRVAKTDKASYSQGIKHHSKKGAFNFALPKTV